MSPKVERWRQSDAPAELQRILASADLDQPSADRLARLSAKLETALGPEWSANGEPSAPEILQPAAAGSGAAVKSAASSSLGPLLAVTTALLLGLSAAYLGLRTPEPEADPQPSAANPVPPAGVPAPAPPTFDPAPAEATPSLEAPGPVPAAKPAARPARAEPRSGGGLGEELRQLEAIRRTLVRDPASALGATDRHARRFPQGALAPERELLKLEALLRLNRTQEAWKLASRALAKPHPYQAQILQLMASAPP